MVLKLSQICICLPFDEYIALVSAKSYSAFPWISAQPLLEPLMNMHTTSYMSVIPAIHETNALREATGGQNLIEKHYHSLEHVLHWPDTGCNWQLHDGMPWCHQDGQI